MEMTVREVIELLIKLDLDAKIKVYLDKFNGLTIDHEQHLSLSKDILHTASFTYKGQSFVTLVIEGDK